MRPRLALGLAATVMAMSCAASRLAAQAAAPSLDSLAAAWSAGHTAPVCTPSANRDSAVQMLGTEECVWAPVGNKAGSGQVTGTRYRGIGLASLTWNLQLQTRAAAIALRDSLGQAFRQLGLTEYSCQNDGRRWQRPGLGVEFYIGAVFPDGLLRVGVMATPLTGALPTIMCPDAPTLPTPRRSTSTRRVAPVSAASEEIGARSWHS